MSTQKQKLFELEKTAVGMSKQDLNIPPRLDTAKLKVEQRPERIERKTLLKNPPKFEHYT